MTITPTSFSSLVAIFAFTACQVSATTPPSLEQQQLEAAQDLWKAQNMQLYQFEYDLEGVNSSSPYPWTITCNPPNAVMAVDANYNQVHGILVPTIDQLFTLIQTEIDTNTDQNIYVEYDTVDGYPRYIDFTRSDGSTYVVDVTNFVTLGTPIPTFSPSDELQQLTQAQTLWESHDIQNYVYQFTMNGMDPRNIDYPWTVSVTNSNQVLGHDGNGNQINWMTTNPHPESFDQLFTTIQDALTASPSAKFVDVTYDDQFGYPQAIYIVYSDGQTPTIDAQISHFQQLVY
jgi:hypothetical protein